MESGARTLGLVLVKDVDKEDSPENLHPVGVAGKILEAIQEDIAPRFRDVQQPERQPVQAREPR